MYLLTGVPKQDTISPILDSYTYAWYTHKWWVGSEAEQEALMREFEGCTAEQRERVAQFILAVVISDFISDSSTVK